MGQTRRKLVPRLAGEAPPAGVLLAEGFPDNLAKRRDASGEEWRRRGQGLVLDPLSSWPARISGRGRGAGSAKGARITGAIALTEAEVLEHLRTGSSGARPCAGWLTNAGSRLCWSSLGAITFARGSDPSPDPAAMRPFCATASGPKDWGFCHWARPA
jgi:ATP-dependent helicase HrpB